MSQSNSSKFLDSELKGFQILEDKIGLLLKKFSELKGQRDRAVQQKAELETLLRRRETQIAQLQDNLTEAQKRSLTPEKEELIKGKLQGLLTKLQDF
ncbi:MAG: hypothetical protein H8E46_08225 [FCB group bacterium]|nr:hypothetical protein [FCB group bacterium]